MADNDFAIEEDDLNDVIDAATSGEAEKANQVVQLLPVHAAPYGYEGHKLEMSRRLGRPRKVERAPSVKDLEYHAATVEEKAVFVDRDPVVQAAKGHTDPLSMLAHIKVEVAKESAALHFQRLENEKYGKDTAQISTRRIDALKKIADMELELKKLGADVINVHSEKFQMIFKLWIDTIKQIAEQTMSPEQIDLFFNQLSTAMENWEEKVEEALR